MTSRWTRISTRIVGADCAAGEKEVQVPELREGSEVVPVPAVQAMCAAAE